MKVSIEYIKLFKRYELNLHSATLKKEDTKAASYCLWLKTHGSALMCKNASVTGYFRTLSESFSAAHYACNGSINEQ